MTAEPSVNSLEELAALSRGKRGRVSERVIYYRKPNRGPEANWITTAGTNAERRDDLYGRGFMPLPKYGFIGTKRREDSPDGPFELYGVWGPILCHPDGPAEFPVDQILTYRWYRPELCPVPGVRFPQLAGHEITEFDCPECNERRYHKATHLARHLRNAHDYDRTELVALGQELGISFAKELTKDGRVKTVYTYEEPEQIAEPEPEPALVSSVRPKGRAERTNP